MGRKDVEVVCERVPGAAAARNCGLAAVDSEYVMFFDSDDVMPAGHVADVVRGLRDNGLPDIGAFDAVIRTDSGAVMPKPFRRGDVMFNHLFHGVLSTQRMVVKTSVIRGCGGWNASLRVWDDLELGVRLLSRGAGVKRLELTAPVTIMSHGDSITGTAFSPKAGLWEAALDCCDKELPRRYASLTDYRRAILAGDYLREGRPDLAAGVRVTHRPWLMALIRRYVAAGGRGVAEIARIFR